MANSVDPDQTAPKEQSDLGLHCLLRLLCLSSSDNYSIFLSLALHASLVKVMMLSLSDRLL